jgi:hypothetical protein
MKSFLVSFGYITHLVAVSIIGGYFSFSTGSPLGVMILNLVIFVLSILLGGFLSIELIRGGGSGSLSGSGQRGSGTTDLHIYSQR